MYFKITSSYEWGCGVDEEEMLVCRGAFCVFMLFMGLLALICLSDMYVPKCVCFCGCVYGHVCVCMRGRVYLSACACVYVSVFVLFKIFGSSS